MSEDVTPYGSAPSGDRIESPVTRKILDRAHAASRQELIQIIQDLVFRIDGLDEYYRDWLLDIDNERAEELERKGKEAEEAAADFRRACLEAERNFTPPR